MEAGCNIIVTWKYVDSGVNFELSANTEGWVAVGFSDDKKMVSYSRTPLVVLS